jgi:hypothetical protein
MVRKLHRYRQLQRCKTLKKNDKEKWRFPKYLLYNIKSKFWSVSMVCITACYHYQNFSHFLGHYVSWSKLSFVTIKDILCKMSKKRRKFNVYNDRKSFKKNRMRFYSIKVRQNFLWLFSLSKPFKNLNQEETAIHVVTQGFTFTLKPWGDICIFIT